MMTAFTCLWAWNRSLTPTAGGGARVVVEGERGGHRKSWQTLTLRKMMMIDSSSSSCWMPGATISRRVVRRSRALLMLSLWAVFAAAFARQKTADAPAGQVLPWPAAVRTGNDAKASAGAAQPARRSFPRQSSFFFFCWGAEAAGAHSEEEEKNNQQQQAYAGGPHAVYGTPYTPHTEEEEEDDHAPVVPSHLIMRAAVEEALSTLEDKSHEAAEKKKKKKNKHLPSTMQEASKGLLFSYGEETHEPAEGEADVDTFSADSFSGDDTLERGGSHDSAERWPEEHVGEIHEEVEHTENPADSVHGLHWRHRVHNNSGHGPKTPAEETFDQYDALLTLIDGGGPREKEVGLDGDVLGAAADPMIPPAEAELGMDGIVGLKRANSRGLALQPITVMLTAMLLAVALMLAHSQSDTAKEFFQQTVLPGRRQDPLNHVPHDMVNHRAGDRYLEPGYIADDLGEHAAVPQVVWMHGDDETAAGPYGNNDFKIQSIEQRIILADPEKDEGEKSSHIKTSQARAYHAGGQSVGDDTLRELFADPVGTVVDETAYKNKKDDGDAAAAESSMHEAPESVESEEAEVGEHHD